VLSTRCNAIKLPHWVNEVCAATSATGRFGMNVITLYANEAPLRFVFDIDVHVLGALLILGSCFPGSAQRVLS
jgi:hypothetical protein